MANTNQVSDYSRMKLVQLIMGYGATQAIACVAKLGIADELTNGARTIEQLACATRTSPFHLGRLMRALCRAGVFSESEAGFNLTPMSRHLCKDAVDSLLPLADFHGDEMYLAFSKLLHNVRTGTPAWDAAIGKSIWDYLSGNPERGVLFDDTMRLNHVNDVQSMVMAYDFSTIRTVADIGGGEGSLLRAILNSQRSILGVLVDLPEVVSRTSMSDAWSELASRCRFVAGNFFEEVPRGIDLYVLRHVLHDWSDEDCVRLLNKCRVSMGPESRVLVIELLMDNSAQYGTAGWPDLGMMVFGGRERTADQYRELLAAAGLAVTRIIHCSRVALIEACRDAT